MTRFITLTFLLFFASQTYIIAQNDIDTTLSSQIDTLVDKKLDAHLKKIQDILKSEKDISDKVGTIYLLNINKKINVYKNKDAIIDTIFITKVELYISDGLIKELRIYTKEGKVFENNYKNRIYMSLTHFDRHKKDKIFNSDKHFIRVGHFLNYEHKQGHNFAPSDDSFTLDTLKTSEILTIKSDLNAYIELKTYTDFLAVIGDEPNGLIQAEAKARILMNTRNIIPKNTFAFNYIEPFLRVSKFDNDFATLEPDTTFVNSLEDSTLVINRTELNQLSKLEVGLRLNVAKYYFGLDSYLELSAIGNYRYSDIQYKQDEKQTANLITYGGEIGCFLPKYKNFSLYCKGSFWWQKIVRGTGFDEAKFKGIRDDGLKMYIIPEFELSYFPKGQENNNIYLRFSTFNILYKNERPFNQLQIGYKIKLNFN